MILQEWKTVFRHNENVTPQVYHCQTTPHFSATPFKSNEFYVIILLKVYWVKFPYNRHFLLSIKCSDLVVVV